MTASVCGLVAIHVDWRAPLPHCRGVCDQPDLTVEVANYTFLVCSACYAIYRPGGVARDALTRLMEESDG